VEKETKRKSRTWLFTVAGVLLFLPLAVFSCNRVYFKTVVKNHIDQFAVSTGVLFQEKLEAEDSLDSIKTTEFKALLAEVSKEVPLAANAYEESDNTHIFVQDHQPTTAHDKLLARAKGLYDDGVTLSPYRTDGGDKQRASLLSLNQDIINSSAVLLSEPEKTALVEDVATASKESGDVLSGIEILDLALLPENAGKYPNVQNAWGAILLAAKTRSKLEAKIETESARRLLMMLAELMGKAQEDLSLWNEFVGDPGACIEKIEPKIPHYAQIKKGLKQYREYAKKPSDPYLFKANWGTKVKEGSSKKDLVLQIKKRLALEGYWNGDMTSTWGPDLTASLTHYQENHQVVTDGVYGRGSAESFNFSMEDRVNQMRLALERLRQSPTRNDDFYLRINIPQMLLEVRETQKVVRTHRIIVGNVNPKNHTPTFSDEIELVIFWPRWFVPERIIKEEMQPGFDKDEEFFKKKGYQAKIDEEGKVTAVTQPAGRGNALGIVKILFPNKHDVYLHDTPSKPLFKRTVRAFSHGCMRTQDADELAKFLLEKDQNPEFANIEQIMEKRRNTKIELQKPIPVHIEYVLASSNEKGEVIFFGDIYKQEKETLLAMTQAE
jgi:L,D-transpeptidase catalytic domain/Putative peptidoglycan binding domain